MEKTPRQSNSQRDELLSDLGRALNKLFAINPSKFAFVEAAIEDLVNRRITIEEFETHCLHTPK